MSWKFFGIHVARVRVEPGEHAVDRRFDQLVVVGHLDVVGADALENVAEQVEFAIGVGSGGVGLGAREELRLHQGGRCQRAEHGASDQ